MSASCAPSGMPLTVKFSIARCVWMPQYTSWGTSSLAPLAESARRLRTAFHELADKHTNDVTIGRTQLQDAVPMTFGQEF